MSLQWRMVHDSPILYYMGFLIDNFHAVPYRDFFDMNMPGAHWLNALIGSIFGFTDSGFQKANILILVTTLALAFIWLRSFGLNPAWASANIFGLSFLQYGPAMSMQREFLTIPFMLLALVFYSMSPASSYRIRYFLIGFFICCAVFIKPQSGLILIIFLFLDGWYLLQKDQSRQIRNFLFSYVCMFAGFFLPIFAALLYFSLNNAIPAFLEVATGYWPLYTDINARLEITSGHEDVAAALAGIPSIGLQALWLIPGGINAFSILKSRSVHHINKNKTVLMIGGILVCLIEVIIANKYWEYHWLPMIFFMIILAGSGFCFMDLKRSWAGALGLLLVCVIVLRPSTYIEMQISGETLPSPQGGRVDDIAEYLEKNLDPGDTVQPLDWSNGAVQSMLMVRATPATRYLYDFHFYHHISTPEIQHLRADFLSKLQYSRPKVVIEFYDGRPWVNGPDTTRDFLGLSNFLVENYYVDVDRGGYRLWMRDH